ncbi:MAG: hypothetical protein U1E31_00160 [Rickettsiales bacterium]
MKKNNIDFKLIDGLNISELIQPQIKQEETTQDQMQEETIQPQIKQEETTQDQMQEETIQDQSKFKENKKEYTKNRYYKQTLEDINSKLEELEKEKQKLLEEKLTIETKIQCSKIEQQKIQEESDKAKKTIEEQAIDVIMNKLKEQKKIIESGEIKEKDTILKKIEEEINQIILKSELKSAYLEQKKAIELQEQMRKSNAINIFSEPDSLNILITNLLNKLDKSKLEEIKKISLQAQLEAFKKELNQYIINIQGETKLTILNKLNNNYEHNLKSISLSQEELNKNSKLITLNNETEINQIETYKARLCILISMAKKLKKNHEIIKERKKLINDKEIIIQNEKEIYQEIIKKIEIIRKKISSIKKEIEDAILLENKILIERQEKERQEKERQEKERQEKERQEKERQEKEKQEKERQEKERQEKERQEEFKAIELYQYQQLSEEQKLLEDIIFKSIYFSTKINNIKSFLNNSKEKIDCTSAIVTMLSDKPINFFDKNKNLDYIRDWSKVVIDILFEYGKIDCNLKIFSIDNITGVSQKLLDKYYKESLTIIDCILLCRRHKCKEKYISKILNDSNLLTKETLNLTRKTIDYYIDYLKTAEYRSMSKLTNIKIFNKFKVLIEEKIIEKKLDNEETSLKKREYKDDFISEAYKEAIKQEDHVHKQLKVEEPNNIEQESNEIVGMIKAEEPNNIEQESNEIVGILNYFNIF